jgi:hypothetical protein
LFYVRFQLEALEDLRHSLRAKGSDLVIRHGKPEDVVAELVQALPNVTAVYMQNEVQPAKLERRLKPSLTRTFARPAGVQRGSRRGKAIEEEVHSSRPPVLGLHALPYRPRYVWCQVEHHPRRSHSAYLKFNSAEGLWKREARS